MRSRQQLELFEQSEQLRLYNEHRREMAAQGYDPDFIGVTEVRQVRCECCGEPIPWRTLRGWQ
jgi:hypothetical protein